MPLWTAITALAAWLGFANPLAHLPLAALLLPAGAFLLGERSATPGKAFRRGWLAGSLGYAGALYWVALPVHDYGYLPWVLAAPCPVLLGMYMGLYTGLFALAARLARPGLTPWWRGMLAGLAWALLEALRGWLFTGFPWLTLASAFAPWPAMLQAASVAGAQGLSALLAGAACLAAAALAEPPRRTGPVLAGLAVLAGLWAGGAWNLSRDGQAGTPLEVVLVQGNIEQAMKWEPAFQAATVQRYASLSRQAPGSAKPGLVVWPETALPFFFQEPSPLQEAVVNAVRELGAPLLTGVPAYEYVPGQESRLFNRACLLDERGRTVGIYDKVHLVPFGEYVPFGEQFPFIKKLAQGAGDFQPGRNTAPLKAGDLALGVLVCYETIFPGLAQQRVEAGANLLVNISNDAWFGRSSAPMQHLHLSVLRAVEQGRWLARGTNTGISAIVDPRGRIRASGSLFRAEAVAGRVELLDGTTWYHRLRGWLIPLQAAAVLLLGFKAALGTGRGRFPN